MATLGGDWRTPAMLPARAVSGLMVTDVIAVTLVPLLDWRPSL